MRKLLAAALVLGSLMQFTPSQAKTENYMAASLPCSVTCHDGVVAGTGFLACETQAMGGNGVGYHSQKFKLLTGAETVISAKPPVDWDIWICTNTGFEKEAEIAYSANPLGGECDSPLGTTLVSVACYEEVTVTFASIQLAVGGNAALAAKGFEIRAFNWSDTGSLQIDLDGDQIKCVNQTPGNGLC